MYTVSWCSLSFDPKATTQNWNRSAKSGVKPELRITAGFAPPACMYKRLTSVIYEDVAFKSTDLQLQYHAPANLQLFVYQYSEKCLLVILLTSKSKPVAPQDANHAADLRTSVSIVSPRTRASI